MQKKWGEGAQEKLLSAGWGVLIVGFVLFSLAPMGYELSRMGDLRPERSFELVHNFPTDYNFYLSRIRQGLEGRWTVIEKYTSEPHDGSFIHELYLLMGALGRGANVPLHRAGDIYHVARVVLAVALLVLIAEFCKRSFGNFRASLLAFLLAVTASSWPKLVAVVHTQVVAATVENIAQWRFGGYMAWWSVMDSLQRITFIPHLVAGQALIVVLIMSLTSRTLLNSGTSILFLGVLAFVLGMIFPPGLLFVYAVMGVWVMLSGRHFRSWLVPYGAIVLVSIASLVYLGLMTGMYPWKRLTEVDIIRPLPFDYWEYIQALGPIAPLGFLGLMVSLWRREDRMYPAVSWVLAWTILLGLFAFVPQQSPLRFSEMIPHVPLGVLTAYLLFQIGRVSYLGHVGRMTAIALVATGLFHMYSSYLWQKDFIDHKIRSTLPLVPTGSYVMYPLKDFVAAAGFIWERTKGEGVILSETTAGNYIPVLSGNAVYAGHDNTVAFEAKRQQVKDFFSGKMDKDQAHIFVRTTRARLVFFGPQEREDAGGKNLTTYYPFLREVYKNAYVTIYQTP